MTLNTCFSNCILDYWRFGAGRGDKTEVIEPLVLVSSINHFILAGHFLRELAWCLSFECLLPIIKMETTCFCSAPLGEVKLSRKTQIKEAISRCCETLMLCAQGQTKSDVRLSPWDEGIQAYTQFRNHKIPQL